MLDGPFRSFCVLKDENYFSRIDDLLNKYNEHPLLSKYVSNQGEVSDVSNGKETLASNSAVTLPGGERLLGIVNRNGFAYALLVKGNESMEDPIEVIEAAAGYELPSGYKLVEINASSIVLQLSKEEEVTVELY